MLIHELAKKTGLSAHTIRFYEKSGLIKGKRKEDVKSNNYFHYDDEVVEKLALIKDAKSIGFTLHEIAELIEAWYNADYSIAEKVEILDKKLTSIQQKIKELQTMENMISQFKEDVKNNNCY